ncbi:hypothetical protein [uncultured Exiguobacterium sp.]|uniref:restriction endonuclease subunit S n=1 Tax=uncultured Exiguobacterium sp. TaxID=202669 RepID=UPI0025E68737|nr:hypothetical protein [uncultured Exiguobacterium sp.]
MFKQPSKIVKKSQLLEKGSLSSKDYSRLTKWEETIQLLEVMDYKVGKTLLSESFVNEELKSNHRFLKTGNLIPYRTLLDTTNVEYCKPMESFTLKSGDILIAKDGNGEGLGEVSIYFPNQDYTDHICGEILCIRLKDEGKVDPFYLLAILKSRYFKDYIDIVTPGGSTLRHSKLAALEFKVPYASDKAREMDYISLIMQNIVHKEQQISEKKAKINAIFENELHLKEVVPKKYPSIKDVRDTARMDTSLYKPMYLTLRNSIVNYSNGHYYLENSRVGPGSTPKDYLYSDEKNDHTALWITPKNITSLELLYKTYINTSTPSKLKKGDLILSGVRYVGYGILVEDEVTYCNQNTLIVKNNNDFNEQVYLLCFFTSNIGKKLQYSWRIDGLVPIIYKDDFCQIPIPNLSNETRQKIVENYYLELSCDNTLTFDNYISEVKERNVSVGIHQLNKELVYLQDHLKDIIFKYINNIEFKFEFFA